MVSISPIMMMGGFSPRSIQGLALWLEADRGITLDGSNNVSAWADQSGNVRHASQATPAYRPAYVTSAINGRPIIRLATSKWMSVITTDLSRNVAGLTMFLCYKPANTTQVSYTFNIRGSAAGTSRACSGINVSGTNGWLVRGTRLDAIAAENLLGGTVTTNPTIQCATFAYANANLTQHVNGTLVASLDPFLTAGNTSDTDPQTARFSYDGPEWTSADLAVAIVYHKALSASERQRLERHYGAKYGITVA